MKKTKFKLPGLPSVPPVPSLTAKTTPPRGARGGFNNSKAQPLNFGKASRAATRSPKSSGTWSNLLSATTSGGLASTLSGAVGFSGGISSIISGLTNLFGSGKTAPPALVAYQLPTSQQQTVSTGSSVSTPGVFGGRPSTSPLAHQSGQIVQTVRQALLNSSSLNDVISEL